MKLLFAVFTLLSVVAYSQKNELHLMDSIHQNEYDSLSFEARKNFFKAPDSTLYYAEKCKLLANRNNNLLTKIDAQFLFGSAWYLTGNYVDAIKIFLDVLKITEATKESNAKSYCLIEIYDGLGCAYSEAGFYKQGIPYLYKAKNLAIVINSADDILNETGSIGTYYEKANEIDSAEYYLNKGLAMTNNLEFEFSRALMLNALGNCEMKRHMPGKAVETWQKTIKYDYTDAISAGLAHQSLGNYYLQNGLYDSSYSHLKQAVEMATKTNNTENLFAAKNLLLTLFKKTNNVDSINFYLNVCYSLRDVVDSKARTKDLQNLYINEQLRQKSLDDAKVEYRNLVILIIFCTVVAAFILLSFFQFRNNKQKQQANIALQHQKEKVESTLSELKSTQSQLIQSEKMASLGELTAGIAHEIQNPLNFVNNFSEVNQEMIEELLSEKSKVRSERDEELENELLNDIKANEQKINHHGKRADAIVKGMLQHSRQTKGMKEPTDINALCDEYLRLSYHGLRAKDKSFNADFTTDFDESIGKINIVPQDIGRVLLNLFNNAFYATSAKQKTADENYKPLVSIQTKKISDKIEIRVEDNGNGIPQNIIDKIFQPFFTTKPTGQGTGLGLSLAYDIITKEHNGTIKVESKEGEGSTFIIQLMLE